MIDPIPVPLVHIDSEVLNSFVFTLPTQVNGKGTGARFDEDDHRDHLFTTHLEKIGVAPGPLPKRKDLRPKMPPVYDQLNLGSCTSQAAIGCDEALRIKHKQPGVRLSRLMNYYLSREVYGEINQDNGATVRQAFKNLKTGVAPESLWPYDMSQWRTKPSEACYEAIGHYQAQEYLSLSATTVRGNQDLELVRTQIKTSLSQEYPVAFAMLLHSNFEPNWQGKIPFPAGEIEGGHALMIVGYDDTSKTWIVRNSWSSSWGGVQRRNGTRIWGGYCRISYEHLDAFGRDYWTLRMTETGE